jgi:hypothetical protein
MDYSMDQGPAQVNQRDTTGQPCGVLLALGPPATGHTSSCVIATQPLALHTHNPDQCMLIVDDDKHAFHLE